MILHSIEKQIIRFSKANPQLFLAHSAQGYVHYLFWLVEENIIKLTPTFMLKRSGLDYYDIRDMSELSNTELRTFFKVYLDKNPEIIQILDDVKSEVRNLSGKKVKLNDPINTHLRKLIGCDSSDYYILQQEPDMLDLYFKERSTLQEPIEYGFKSIEDVARYICILQGQRNPHLFPGIERGRGAFLNIDGERIMFDTNAQEVLKTLLDDGYKIWPDSQGHSFTIIEDDDTIRELINKYHLTIFRRDADKYGVYNVYNGDIVDYVNSNTNDGEDYRGPRTSSSYRDLLKQAHAERREKIDVLNSNKSEIAYYEEDMDMEFIYKQMNEINDDESINEH